MLHLRWPGDDVRGRPGDGKIHFYVVWSETPEGKRPLLKTAVVRVTRTRLYLNGKVLSASSYCSSAAKALEADYQRLRGLSSEARAVAHSHLQAQRMLKATLGTGP